MLQGGHKSRPVASQTQGQIPVTGCYKVLQSVIGCCRVLQGGHKSRSHAFFVEQKGRFELIQRPCCHGPVNKFWVNKKVSVSHRFISIVQLSDAVLINFAY